MKFKMIQRGKQVLKCYEIEIAKYKHFYNIWLDIDEALLIFTMLERRYKIKVPKITFNYKSKNHGGWTKQNGEVKLKKNYLNLGIICHEYIHVYELIKFKKTKHDRKFYKRLDRVIKFIEKNLELAIKCAI